MNLFQLGNYKLHSGDSSDYIIDCNALTDEDLECIASQLQGLVGLYGKVEGIPNGGLRLAEKMKKYITPISDRLLITDDVCTTGRSFIEHRNNKKLVAGVCIFARGILPNWVKAWWYSHNVINQLEETQYNAGFYEGARSASWAPTS